MIYHLFLVLLQMIILVAFYKWIRIQLDEAERTIDYLHKTLSEIETHASRQVMLAKKNRKARHLTPVAPPVDYPL